MPLFRQQLAAGGRVRFSARGVSMLPLLRQGLDSVEIGPVPEKLKKYDLPFYQRDNGQYVLHRIVGVGQTYSCVGDNEIVPEKGIRHDQVIAVVTAVYRGDVRWEVTNWRYQLYCRVRHYTRPVRGLWRSVRGRLRKLFKKQ